MASDPVEASRAANRDYQSAKLAAGFDSSGTLCPIYISGVGTPFNGRAVDWLSEAVAWVEDGIPGQGAAAGGHRRIEHGGDTVNQRLRFI